jgi:hypothetical protein
MARLTQHIRYGLMALALRDIAFGKVVYAGNVKLNNFFGWEKGEKT